MFNRTKEFIKAIVGAKGIRSGWLLARFPADVLRRSKKEGDDPEELKRLNFDELLERWEIPRKEVPRLKRVLTGEMIAYLCLACLGLSNLVFRTGLITGLLGLLIAVVA
ncbi:MAG: hypothetical protein R6U40_08035, partial [Desulfobacterales bacterium]